MRELVQRVDRLQRLAVFESAARLGSFTAAAAELGMTQPAVTRQIRLLETSIRADLFRRTSNRSHLTDAGITLHREVSQGFSAMERVLTEIAPRTDVFVLACHPGLAQQWLMPRLDQLQATLAGSELRLWIFDRDSELEGGAYDAAIRVGDGNFADAEAKFLFGESVLPVAAPTLAAKLGLDASTPPATLAHAPLLHMDDGDRPWMSWKDWFSHHGVRLPRRAGRVLFNNYPMVLQQTLAGRGVALGWRHLVDDLLDDRTLIAVGTAVGSDRGYYLTWPRTRCHHSIPAVTRWLLGQLAP